MEITTRQLRAIEDAIGRNAEAKVILRDGWYGYRGDFRHSGDEVIIEVTTMHKGQKVASHMSIHPYRDIPMRHIAENLVHGLNRHIMDEEFRGVFPR